MRQVPQLPLNMTRLFQQTALALFAFLEVLLHSLPPDNFTVQPQVCGAQFLQAALRLFGLLAIGNVAERDPAPSPRTHRADCGRGSKNGPKSASTLLQQQRLTLLVLGLGQYIFQEGHKDRVTFLVRKKQQAPVNQPGPFHAQQGGTLQIRVQDHARFVNGEIADRGKIVEVSDLLQ